LIGATLIGVMLIGAMLIGAMLIGVTHFRRRGFSIHVRFIPY
jgi:hypothetical protein